MWVKHNEEKVVSFPAGLCWGALRPKFLCAFLSGESSLPREWWGAGRAAQRGWGCPGPEGVQGQVGWGPGQPGLVLDMDVGGPACSRKVGASWSLRSLPTQAILWFFRFLMTHTCLFVHCLSRGLGGGQRGQERKNVAPFLYASKDLEFFGSWCWRLSFFQDDFLSRCYLSLYNPVVFGLCSAILAGGIFCQSSASFTILCSLLAGCSLPWMLLSEKGG